MDFCGSGCTVQYRLDLTLFHCRNWNYFPDLRSVWVSFAEEKEIFNANLVLCYLWLLGLVDGFVQMMIAWYSLEVVMHCRQLVMTATYSTVRAGSGTRQVVIFIVPTDRVEFFLTCYYYYDHHDDYYYYYYYYYY